MLNILYHFVMMTFQSSIFSKFDLTFLFIFTLCLDRKRTLKTMPKVPHTQISLGPVYEFVCVSFSTGNLNCFRVK